MFILDTNIVSYAVRSCSDALRAKFIEYASELCISEITRAELLFGIYRCKGVKREKLSQKINLFLENVPALPFSGKVVEIFAQLRADLFKNGNITEDFDIMIASTAIANNATLVTNNEKHFSHISNILLENWTI